MNALRSAAIAALLTVSTIGPASADEKAPALKGDLAKLQGKWKGTVGPDNNMKLTLTIEGTDVTMALKLDDGQDFESKGTLKVDESNKPYKAIDFLGFNSPNGEEIREARGIYDFEDNENTLKLCSGGQDTPRPTALQAGEGDSPPYLIILTRSGEKKKAATEAPAPKGDLARFQGTWKAMIGPDKDLPLIIVFKDNGVAVTFTRPDGQDVELKGEIKLDESAKPNKTIDWIKFTRPSGEEAPENLGIYEFEGDDALKLCSGGPGNGRPTEFKAGDEGRPMLVVLKREKN